MAASRTEGSSSDLGIVLRMHAIDNAIANQETKLMKLAEVRERAFAMPLNDPAYPKGPYKFYNREFVVITYRTDPDELRAVVPEPLEVDGRHGRLRVHPHARFDRLRRLHRDRPGHPGALPGPGRRGAGRRLRALPCISTTIRRSPAGARSGGFPRSWPVRRCRMKARPLSARCTTARCSAWPATMGYKHQRARSGADPEEPRRDQTS